jgi:hypothetical protein
MQAFMKRQTSQVLAFFAQGQAIGPRASTENLLREALKVLGADYAVFWCVPEKPKPLPFEACVWVPNCSEVKTRSFWLDTNPDLIRERGMTHGIYQYAKTQKCADALFCIHVLSGLRNVDRDFPDYSFEVYTSSSGDNSFDADNLAESGSYGGGNPSNFPGIDKPIELNRMTEQHPHTQVGLGVCPSNSFKQHFFLSS